MSSLPRRSFWGQTPPPDFEVDKDYYKILGVSQNASKADIKKKYFTYVQTMHPDRNPNANQDKFKELTSAYNLLSNEKKRKEYDEYRRITGAGGQQTSSSNYGSQRNPYGDGFNPFGQGGQRSQSQQRNQNSHYQQKYGDQGQYQRYEYRANPKSQEEMKKEFEEFFKKAANAFNKKNNQRGPNGQKGQQGFQGGPGFDDFSKRFWESYENQRQQ